MIAALALFRVPIPSGPWPADGEDDELSAPAGCPGQPMHQARAVASPGPPTPGNRTPAP
jgi:hypothetical protein